MAAPLRKTLLQCAASGASALVLALSWVPDSHLARLPLLPARLGRWLDSGGVMATARTGLAMAVAATLIHLARGGRAPLGSAALALALLGAAEAGQLLLPNRRADPLDLLWGAGGVALGLTVALALGARQVPVRQDSARPDPAHPDPGPPTDSAP